MKNILRDTKKLLMKNKRSLLLFELLYKAVFFMVMIPIIKLAFKVTLNISSFSYLTLENIAVFLTEPFTLLILFLILAVLGLFTLIEGISIIIYCYSCIKNRKIPVDQILFPGLIQTERLLRKKKNPMLAITSLILTLFMMLPLVAAILTQMRIPSYVLASALKNKLVVCIALLILMIAMVFAYRGIFILHFAGLEDMGFKAAFRASCRLQKGHHREIIANIAAWNLILIVIYYILYYGILFIAAFVTYMMVEKELIYMAFLRVYEQVSLYVGVVVGITAVLANLGLFTNLYAKYQEGNRLTGHRIDKLQERIAFAEQKELKKSNRRRRFIGGGKYKQVTTILAVVVIAVNCIYVYDKVKNGSKAGQEALFGFNVTAHRGASADAPENTVPALEKAVELLADYAEIDVQETKDGVVVLLHDTSLRRTTGVPKNIWDITYLELLTLDAGVKFSKEYEGTRIPTFAEALEFCKGKINLNIEIKLNGHDQGVVEKVVKLIEQYDFEAQCVISSANYTALAKVKELNSDIKTGYILSIAYGNFYNNKFADFFSVKSSFIDDNMVRLAHRLGKEVHAWTVNTVSEMERMKKLGVDNIITDKPLLAKQTLYSEAEDTTFLAMFRRLIKEKDL